MVRDISGIVNKDYDLLVIGGGITGAAIAYEGSGRGLSVALFEKDDFGGATSAATSKMIHGGLRYLARLEIGIVRESLKERKVLCNIAPNFVHPVPNIILMNKGDKMPGWILSAGLILYDLLSFCQRKLWDKSKHMPLHRHLQQSDILEKEPLVCGPGLKGGLVYTDCLSVSPERLTLAFLRSAVREGAKIANYTEVTGFTEEKAGNEKRITGLKFIDRLSGLEHFVHGRCIINCAGPWVDIILSLAGSGSGKDQLKRSEGIHLVTRKLVSDHIVAATTPAGKHCFIVPWRDHSLIGTTDREYTGDPGHYRITQKAISDFLEEINPVFGKNEPLNPEDVMFAYGGLRPLTGDRKNDVYRSSRKYEIVNHDKEGIKGLISVVGGKYTTSRNLAEKTIGFVAIKLGKKLKKSVSDKKYLAGCEIENFSQFAEKIKNDYPQMNDRQAVYLAQNYGTDTGRLVGMMIENPALADTFNNDGETGAQVVYAIREEMAMTLSDIVFRRTGIGTLGNPGTRVIEKVAEMAAYELGWDHERMEDEIRQTMKKFVYED